MVARSSLNFAIALGATHAREGILQSEDTTLELSLCFLGIDFYRTMGWGDGVWYCFGVHDVGASFVFGRNVGHIQFAQLKKKVFSQKWGPCQNALSVLQERAGFFFNLKCFEVSSYMASDEHLKGWKPRMLL